MKIPSVREEKQRWGYPMKKYPSEIKIALDINKILHNKNLTSNQLVV